MHLCIRMATICGNAFVQYIRFIRIVLMPFKMKRQAKHMSTHMPIGYDSF